MNNIALAVAVAALSVCISTPLAAQAHEYSGGSLAEPLLATNFAVPAPSAVFAPDKTSLARRYGMIGGLMGAAVGVFLSYAYLSCSDCENEVAMVSVLTLGSAAVGFIAGSVVGRYWDQQLEEQQSGQ